LIGFLRGMLIEKTVHSVILDVQGVGYELEVPASTFYNMPSSAGVEIALHVVTHVREDAIRLFGFIHKFDKLVFEELISVSGIGPKVALTLLGGYNGYELSNLIIEERSDALTLTPGIGPKTADRIVLELKGKMQKLVTKHENALKEVAASKSSQTPREAHMSLFPLEGASKEKLSSSFVMLLEDLKSALLNLGYKDKQCQEAISIFKSRLEQGETLSFETLLKEALKNLSLQTKSLLQQRQ
jgi:Holliday junction DNA helicase RuvA